MNTERLAAIHAALQAAYTDPGLWGESRPDWPLPPGMARGDVAHLAYLTLVYTLSGGRDPQQLWGAARQTYAADPQLFDPQFLAYSHPAQLIPRLHAYQLTQKPKSEATSWQRIGQALVMRAEGSVSQLLAVHHYDAAELLHLLTGSKTTFPLLSGPQTAPRWLYGLSVAGAQPLVGAAHLPVPPSPAITRAVAALSIPAGKIAVELFAPLNALGHRGCSQCSSQQAICPMAAICPVARFCRYSP